jgi:hypothetical protein
MESITYEQGNRIAGDQSLVGDDCAPAGAQEKAEAPAQGAREAWLASAMGRAGTLILTVPESVALRAPFAAALVKHVTKRGRKDNYLPHILISGRLTEVLGGEWSIVRVRDWIAADGLTVYGSYVLIVRGCHVGDTIQGWPYHPSNRDGDYGDALEACRARALARIAAKSCLGVGDQVWADDDHDKLPRPVQGPPVPLKKPPAAQGPAPDPMLIRLSVDTLTRAAEGGTVCLAAAWVSIPTAVKRVLLPDRDRLKLRAAEMDALGGEERVGV